VEDITHYYMAQDSEEWHRLRAQCLTSSEMTKVLQPSTKERSQSLRSLVAYKVYAQLTENYEEAQIISPGILRGKEFEPIARSFYEKHFQPVREIGLVTRQTPSGVVGASTDGLIGDDGLLEIKCLGGSKHFLTCISDVPERGYEMQVQTELFVTGRRWCHLMFYNLDLGARVVTVYPDPEAEAWIRKALDLFYYEVARVKALFERKTEESADYIIKGEVVEI